MRHILLLNMLAAAVCFAGCAKPGTKKVTGMVKLDGDPVADADVRFVPKDDLTLGEFGGRTGPDGKFAIDVGGPGMNAKPGTYVALVTKGVGVGFPPAPKSEEEAKKGPPPSGGSLPNKYADPKTSPFVVEIKGGQTELAPFELTGGK